MGKWYWIIVVVVLVSGLTATLYFGLQGKTVPLIKWSHFSNPTEVSDAIQTRMSQEFKSKQIYFIGPHPQKPFQIQTALNVVNWIRSFGPHVLIVDTMMSEKNSDIQQLKADLVFDLAKDQDRLLEGIKNMSSDTKIIVLAPNIYVTHLFQQSPVSLMQEQLKTANYVVLSFFNFPGSREEEKDFEFPCRTSETSASQLDLGCFIVSQSRSTYAKRKVEGKIPGFLNLVRTHEYMFFLGQ